MDSNDRNPNNNAVIFNIEVSSRIASNTTQTSANRGANHGPRQGSQEESPIREQDPTPDPTPDPEPEPNPQPDPNPDPTPDPNPDPTPDPNPDPNPDPEPDNGPGVKTTESFTSAVSDIFDYLGDIFSSDDENLSGDVVKAIAAQNYIKFPILVFAVFMFVILGSVVYDKIKI